MATKFERGAGILRLTRLVRPPPLRLVLVTNPADDRGFAAAATRLAAEVVGRPEALQAMLRMRYRRAVVRRRDLAGEQFETWYVYRDGRWTASRSVTAQAEGRS
jgi:hypothetical protein